MVPHKKYLRLRFKTRRTEVARRTLMWPQRYVGLLFLFALLAGAHCFAAELTEADVQYLRGLTGMGSSAPLFRDMTAAETANLHDLINEPATQGYSQRDTLVFQHLRDVYARQCADWAKVHASPSCPPARDPHVQPGKEIADRLCHACHLLGTFEARSFHKMAASQAPIKDQLRSALASGHRMSPITLSDKEFTELQAYIESLSNTSPMPPPATPGSSGNVRDGANVAHDVCTTCHYVAVNQDVEPVWKNALPSFMDVANRPGMSEGQIVVFVTSKHASSSNPTGMPKLSISPAQVRDVAAYIMTLRGR